jgi:type VI protein secretion system component VasK
LLSEAEKRFPNPQRLATIAGNYTQVLNGMGEVSGVFTPEGWNYLRNASRNAKSSIPGDSCVEETTLIGGVQQNLELERSIQRLFVRDYIDRWQKFVKSFSVIRYSGPADAARKLDVLADHKSPLLAVFALTSKNTYFPAAAVPSQLEKPKKAAMDLFGKAKEAVGGQTEISVLEIRSPAGQAEIASAFQPVQWVVPAASETWVTDKNNAYVDALAQLGHSMQEISRGGELDPAIPQTANQNYDKALAAARQLEQRLAPNSNGVDDSVQRLLAEPIVQTQRFIPMPVDPTGKINGAARNFCASISSTLHKYPFQQSTVDAQINELSRLFAPASGEVWKFEADKLADLVIKDGGRWKAKDGAKVAITSGMLNFLNRAQAVSDAFFANGANQPQLLYTLRPKLDQAYKDAFIELEMDGVAHQWKTSLQKQFMWPASPAASKLGAIGRVVTGSLSFPFASRGGPWAVFRMMGDAEPRAISSKIVEWKYLHSGDGRLEPITPAPVRLEIVEFPGGVDVFNPKFFEGLQCSGRAVQ